MSFNTSLEMLPNNIKYSINNMSVLNFIFNFTIIIILSISILFSLLNKYTAINIDLFGKIFFDFIDKSRDTHKLKMKYIILLGIILAFIFISFTIFANFTTKNTKELNNVNKDNIENSNNIIKSVLTDLNNQIPHFSISLGISLFLILFLVLKNIITFSKKSEGYKFNLKYTWIFILLLLVIILISIISSIHYVIESNKPIENKPIENKPIENNQ